MRILLSLVLSLFLSSTSFAAVNQVCEEDGSPCFFPWKLKFTNGTLSDNLNGTGSVVTGAGVYTGVLVGDGASTSGVTSSAGIASAIGDETGSGAMVFGTSPKFTTSITSAIVYGSEADNGDLTIHGTSSATRTTSDVLIQPTAGKVGIGNSAPDSTLHVTGSFKVEGTGSGTLAIGNGATSGGILQINEDTDAGSNNATFTVPSLAADTDYTLPADDGDAGERLRTDGAGVLTWEPNTISRTWSYPENPVETDDNKSIWCNDTGVTFTVTKLKCESDQTVTMMLQVDDGSAADMDSVDLVCVSTPDTDTALDGDATVGDGECIDVATTSVSGTPTWASVTFTGAGS